MFSIPYYRCSIGPSSASGNNRQGFCFKECDERKIQDALALDDDMLDFKLAIHHGVRVIRSVGLDDNFGYYNRFVIFHDDSFFKAHPNVFKLSDKEPSMTMVRYIKKGDPIFSRLPGYIAEWYEKQAYPVKCKKTDDTTIVARSKDDSDFFFINFEFERQPLTEEDRLLDSWSYVRKFDTKEEADKMMEIFQFYGV